MLLAISLRAALVVAAAGDTATSSPSGLPEPLALLLPYLNLGIIVVLVILLVTKKGFVPKWTLDDLKTSHDAALAEIKASHDREMAAEVDRRVNAEKREDEYKRLNADLQDYQRDQLQPALIETTRVASAYVQALSRKGGDV